MTAAADIAPEGPLGGASEPRADRPRAPLAKVRPLYWSLRRELWENRSLYIAPSIAAAVILVGDLLFTIGLSHSSRGASAFDPVAMGDRLAHPYDIAAVVVAGVSMIMAIVYCLGALNGERRDRSVLFWKSLPVSDLTTVLAKAIVPLAILPVITFAVVIATQFAMLLMGTAQLLAHGMNAGALWVQLQWFQRSLVLAYGLVVLALWNAPLYGWMLLVSGWAKRVTFLWAFLPPLALCLVEKIAFDTDNVATLLKYRLFGAFGEAFATHGHMGVVDDPLQQINAVGFLSSPGLWTGLVAAAGLLAGAVWMRRNREPV